MILEFYRGLKNKYNIELHGSGIYFTTDTLEIIHNGNSYSGIVENKTIKDIIYNNNILTIIYYDDTFITIDLTKIDIINNLDSTREDAALSANQGKILKDEIDNIKNKIVKIYTYKGTVESYENLPSNPNSGDVYNVINAYGNQPAGTNYAWVEDVIGGHWDALGGSIDFSNYLTRLTNIENLLGTPTDNTNTILSRLDTLETLSENNLNILQRVENIETVLYGEDNLTGLIKVVEILNNDATVEGSVDYKINQAFAWIEV